MTIVANSKAIWSVIYADSDSAKKVTITVDQYPTASDASSAYQEAVAKANRSGLQASIRGEPWLRTPLSEQWTQGETHIGLGALDGVPIVGATLAGYNSTLENIAKLISLTREPERVAKTAMDRNE